MPLIDKLREGLAVAAQHRDLWLEVRDALGQVAQAQEAVFRQEPVIPASPTGRNFGGVIRPNDLRVRTAADGPAQVVLVDPAGRPITLGGGGGTGPQGGPRFRTASAPDAVAASGPAPASPYAGRGMHWIWPDGPDGPALLVYDTGLAAGPGASGSSTPGAAGGAPVERSAPFASGLNPAFPGPPPISPYAGRGMHWIWPDGPDGKPILVYDTGLAAAGSTPTAAASGGDGGGAQPPRPPAPPSSTPPVSPFDHGAYSWIWPHGPDGEPILVYTQGLRISPISTSAGGGAPGGSGAAQRAPSSGGLLVPPPGFDSSGHVIPVQGPSTSAPTKPTPGEAAIVSVLDRIDAKLRTDPGAVSMRGPV